MSTPDSNVVHVSNGDFPRYQRLVRKVKTNSAKRGLDVSEAIAELQHEALRENALRCLSGHLEEVQNLYNYTGLTLCF